MPVVAVPRQRRRGQELPHFRSADLPGLPADACHRYRYGLSLPSTRENANFSPLQLWAVHASESAQRRASRRLAIDVIAPAAARRAGGSRLCGDEDPLKDLLELKRLCAQTGGGADDLRNAVNAMDQVSKKLLDAIGLVLSHLSHMHLRRPLRMAGLLAAFVDSCCATTPRL